MAREYRYGVESFQRPRVVMVTAKNVKEVAEKYTRTYPGQDIRRIYRIAWEAPEKRLGRKTEQQMLEQREAYEEAVRELLNA